MCTKLRIGAAVAEIPESLKNNAEDVKSLRVAPSICDLLHLKELKLRFSRNLEADDEFGSQVTGIYAFSQMPRTQFIISYDPKLIRNGEGNLYNDSGDDFDYAQLRFASIKPYVKIVHEEGRPYY